MECTVPVEVRLVTEHADVGSLERTVSAALADVGVRLWRELVARLEAALPVPDRCAGCGGRLKANGRAPRRLVTLAGELELRRRRYRCTACGAEHVPLDAALGLEPRIAHTLGVRERGLWLVTEMSYAKAVETAAELRNWPIGRGELHRWVAAEGAALEAARAADAEGLAELLAGWACEEAGPTSPARTSSLRSTATARTTGARSRTTRSCPSADHHGRSAVRRRGDHVSAKREICCPLMP